MLSTRSFALARSLELRAVRGATIRSFAATSNSTTNSKNSPILDFSNTQVAFQSKSLGSLLNAYQVFSVCQIESVVKNAEKLLKLSNKVFGKSLTSFVVKRTFFRHFCAGEDENDIRPTVESLQASGIGSILDYAAESDIDSEAEKKPKQAVQCRTYDYSDEVACDKHAETFEKCIRAVKAVSPTGFAAIKITALGNPELLKRASIALVELRNLFLKFDPNDTGFITCEQFAKVYSELFSGSSVDAIFTKLDSENDGRIDYIEWTNQLPLESLHHLASSCREAGPFARAVLNEEEAQLFTTMRKRIDRLATLAHSLGVRLMIDAEHTYFQPAIDNLTTDLMKRFNREYPAIFGTYQMYLKDSKHRLHTDLERARRGNYKFAAKLVRGAYMVLEREHAAKNGLPDPIHDNLESTHNNYNGAVRELITEISKRGNVEVMIASHNQKSVENALSAMRDVGLNPSAGVYFGQLLGMSDHITFSLGASGYKAYKYVPYGKVEEVMPYLIRRAQENSGMLSGAIKERKLLGDEIKRRIF